MFPGTAIQVVSMDSSADGRANSNVRTTTPFVPALPFVAISLINPPLLSTTLSEGAASNCTRVLIWRIESRNRNERKSWKCSWIFLLSKVRMKGDRNLIFNQLIERFHIDLFKMMIFIMNIL